METRKSSLPFFIAIILMAGAAWAWVHFTDADRRAKRNATNHVDPVLEEWEREDRAFEKFAEEQETARANAMERIEKRYHLDIDHEERVLQIKEESYRKLGGGPVTTYALSLRDEINESKSRIEKAKERRDAAIKEMETALRSGWEKARANKYR